MRRLAILAAVPVNVIASDNCDPSPAITFAEQRVAGGCPDSSTLRRTWTATDRCGNHASATQCPLKSLLSE